MIHLIQTNLDYKRQFSLKNINRQFVTFQKNALKSLYTRTIPTTTLDFRLLRNLLPHYICTH